MFVALLAASAALRLLWLNLPSGYLIFDEWWYVNAARVILGMPQSGGLAYPQIPFPLSSAVGLDPNLEHPPLVKLIIAVSMFVFGDNAYGWRGASVFIGMVVLVAFYLLVRSMTPSRSLPVMAAGMLALDTLTLVQSRVAMLDIFMEAFMLLGFYFYVSRRRKLSGLMLALSALAKITGVFGLLTVLVFHLASGKVESAAKLREGAVWAAKYVAWYVCLFFTVFLALDQFTVFKNPAAHLWYLLQFAVGKTSACSALGFCPWQWFFPGHLMDYLSVSSGIAFWGAVNPVIMTAALPAMVYSVYSFSRYRNRIALFSLVWFSCTYLPYLVMALAFSRTTYPFYFLPAVPAVCLATANLLTEQRTPRLMIGVIFVLLAIAFIALFPFQLWVMWR